MPSRSFRGGDSPYPLVLTSVLLLAAAPLAAQTTIHVPADQPTIQAAIDFAVAGDTVLVAPGTYTENISFNGKAITVTSSGGPAVTTIDGGAANAVVRFTSGEGRDSVLEGFTLTNGHGGTSGGGGIRIQSSSPTVRNNDVVNNVSCTSGGGIKVNFSSPLIEGNFIAGNGQQGCSGGSGGGIYVAGAASAEIVGNVIADNSWATGGGGISLFAAGTPTLRDNLIVGNTTSQSGGGIDIVNVSNALIVQNLIAGNSAAEGGGVAWLVPSSGRGPFLVNNTIAFNSAAEGSGVHADGFDVQAELVGNVIVASAGQTAVYCGNFNDPNPPFFGFNNVYSATGAAYGGICVDQTGSNGNISADPLFVDPANDDYHLQAGSPSIDAGDNANPDLPAVDVDGEPRIVDGDADTVAVVDQGYDELFVNSPPSVTITAPANGSVFDDGASVTFTATAADAEDGDLSGDVSWSSDLDGALGTGASIVTSTLSLGVHTITASVADSLGEPASDAITVTINAPPVVTVTAPAGGSTFGTGDAITFSASAVDPEDGDISAALVWTSDLEGVIGSGGSFATTALSAGTHLVTASVTDSLGASDADAVTVIVKVPIQVTFVSVSTEDGWVRESQESSSVGGTVSASAGKDKGVLAGDDRNDRQYRGFVSFDTSAIPDGATLRSAVLRLRRTQVEGTSPFVTHGALNADVRTGGFSGSTVLESSDFEAAASVTGAATLSEAAADGDWSEGALNAAGLGALNVAGTTQLRVYFDLDDDDDRSDDYVHYFSADHADPASHPQLVVEYLD